MEGGYLERTEVLIYLSDVLQLLARKLQDNPRINPVEFVNDYFHSVVRGEQILFRKFSFINATKRNRRDFLGLLWRTSQPLAESGDQLNAAEFHQLIVIICMDFPFDVVMQAARIVLVEDSLECPMSFVDFFYALQIQFYYSEFVKLCNAIFLELEKRHGTVSSEEFYQRLVADRALESINRPSLDILKIALNMKTLDNPVDFFIRLAKSDIVAAAVGALPKRAS